MDPTKRDAQRIKDKQVYEMNRSNPEWVERTREIRESKKAEKKLYDAARRQNLPPDYIRAISKRYMNKLLQDPARKERYYAVQKQTKRNSVNSKLAHRLRERLRKAMNGSGARKSQATEKLLGASIFEVRCHLENQFTAGMTWHNAGHGEYEWEIDHCKALASFDLTDPAQVAQAFHISNLQPLWSVDNREKSAKSNWERSMDLADHMLTGLQRLFDDL